MPSCRSAGSDGQSPPPPPPSPPPPPLSLLSEDESLDDESLSDDELLPNRTASRAMPAPPTATRMAMVLLMGLLSSVASVLAIQREHGWVARAAPRVQVADQSLLPPPPPLSPPPPSLDVELLVSLDEVDVAVSLVVQVPEGEDEAPNGQECDPPSGVAEGETDDPEESLAVPRSAARRHWSARPRCSRSQNVPMTAARSPPTATKLRVPNPRAHHASARRARHPASLTMNRPAMNVAQDLLGQEPVDLPSGERRQARWSARSRRMARPIRPSGVAARRTTRVVVMADSQPRGCFCLIPLAAPACDAGSGFSPAPTRRSAPGTCAARRASPREAHRAARRPHRRTPSPSPRRPGRGGPGWPRPDRRKG